MYTYNRLKMADCYSYLMCLLVKCSEYTKSILKVDLFKNKEHTITG